MDNKVLTALKIELGRNIEKQMKFSDELSKCSPGSLVAITIHGDKYLYRKFREKNKIKSVYIGPVDSKEALDAYRNREKFIKLKEDIKLLKVEEKKLLKTIEIYESIKESVETPTSEFSKNPPWNT